VHTFATWLEDGGIPARVIDEVMGHEATGWGGQQRGSAMGAHYRHTTPAMVARVMAAVQERLVVVRATAEARSGPTTLVRPSVEAAIPCSFGLLPHPRSGTGVQPKGLLE
jgi:hypothetical protein